VLSKRTAKPTGAAAEADRFETMLEYTSWRFAAFDQVLGLRANGEVTLPRLLRILLVALVPTRSDEPVREDRTL
jgi:hypothetical protein